MQTNLGFTVQMAYGFSDAITRVTDALRAEGFGVLTEIDVKETMKKKLGEEINPYTILGACNPQLAHRALKIAPEVGLLLPCNVVLRQTDNGSVEISLVDPLIMMGIVGKPELETVAQEARGRLERVAAALKA